ncbi:CUB domain-containing protein [Caerostris extrusa]|uniref:CUB domain-containing protein n=1 Tax=Caerostris extrusa TaxID=172846 RepID=A0AAV4WV08_CAEEX|nr:CUB domain-containing protein [Caerostris extrusa]
MSFHSDNETRGLGYMVTVVQQDCPLPTCDATFDQASFVMSSPNYPFPTTMVARAPTLSTSRTPGLQAPAEGGRLRRGGGPHCGSDFLNVGGDRLCGVMTEGQILDISFANTTMVLEFQSDHVTTRDGFQFNVHQELCDMSTEGPVFTSELYNSVVTETATDVNVSNTPISE